MRDSISANEALVAAAEPAAFRGVARSECTEEALEPELPIIDCHHHLSEHWGGYLCCGNCSRIQVVVIGSMRLCTSNAAGIIAKRVLESHCDRWGRLKPSLHWPRKQRGSSAPSEHCRRNRCFRGSEPGRVNRLRCSMRNITAGKGRLRGIRMSAARHPQFKHGVLPRPILEAICRPGLSALATPASSVVNCRSIRGSITHSCLK